MDASVLAVQEKDAFPPEFETTKLEALVLHHVPRMFKCDDPIEESQPFVQPGEIGGVLAGADTEDHIGTHTATHQGPEPVFNERRHGYLQGLVVVVVQVDGGALALFFHEAERADGVYIDLAVEGFRTTGRADHPVEEIAAGFVGAQAVHGDQQVAFATLGIGEAQSSASCAKPARVDAQHEHPLLVVAEEGAVEGGDDAPYIIGVCSVEGVEHTNAFRQLYAIQREGEHMFK